MIDENELEENLDQIVGNIKSLQRVGRVLSESELNEQTVLWLLSRASGVPQRDVKLMMESLYNLEEIFLKIKSK